MHPHLSRRLFVRTSAYLLAGASLAALPGAAQEQKPAPAGLPKAPPKPPALPPDKVSAVVGAAHRSLEQVRELVEETPLLVHACWDHGGGDFETPLEAAAHTGGREIAEYLLSKGARPNLFAAGMLGQLPLVQAYHAVHPKASEIHGPHGFTLYHCVKEGGEAAKPVLDWLLAQGGSEVRKRPLPWVWPPGTEPPKA